MGVVSDISFGAECDDVKKLAEIAKVIYEEPAEYKNLLSHELARGLSFPVARENAVMMYLNNIKRYANIMSKPNNILAMEYLKALSMQKSKMRPVIIKREKVLYNDKKIVDNFASASEVRSLMEKQEYALARKVVPRSTFKIMGEEFKKGNLILGLDRYEKD